MAKRKGSRTADSGNSQDAPPRDSELDETPDRAETPKKGGRKKKSTLPAFGFSKDLLKKKSSEQDEEPTGEQVEPASAESPPVESPSAELPSVSEPDAAKPSTAAKETLSAPFGFAEDLLREIKERKEREARAAASPSESSASEGSASEGSALVAAEVPSAEVPTVEAASQDVGPTNSMRIQAARPLDGREDRVFAFADSLDDARRDDAAQEARRQVRMESWLTLSLGDEIFALPVEPVRQVLRISAITRVPHAPYPIRGVTNMRGRVIPVIDLRIRLELPEEEIGRNSRIIVVASRGRLLGLLVDGVHQVVHLDMMRMQQPPEDVVTIQSDYIRGVYHLNEKLILLLDVDRVLIIRESEGRRGAA